MALLNSYWLMLPWPVIDRKANVHQWSCHKKCYWRDFDVAAGGQAFTLSAAQLLRTCVKSTSRARKMTSRRSGTKVDASMFKVICSAQWIILILIISHEITNILNN